MTFTARPGAVTAEGSDVVLHYGAIFTEQRALNSGGVVSRADLGVIQLTGSERLTWLDTISSQALGTLRPGESAETLILDPHGHIEFALHLVDDGEAAWVSIPSDRFDAAFAWLNRMRFRADVQLRDAREDTFVVAQFGDITAPLDAHGWPVWHDPWPGVTAGGFRYGDREPAWPVREWFVPRSAEVSLVDELDVAQVPIAGVLAWRALRIAAGRPELTDIDDRALPHEFDWLRTAVHLNKGCYRGQETVAKVHNLGRPPRRLVLLHLDGSDSVVVEPGDEVWAVKADEPRSVGHIVAAGQHWELGPIALALVKRAMPVDLPVAVRHGGVDVAATQDALVPSEAGPAVDLPRLPRLGLRP